MSVCLDRKTATLWRLAELLREKWTITKDVCQCLEGLSALLSRKTLRGLKATSGRRAATTG